MVTDRSSTNIDGQDIVKPPLQVPPPLIALALLGVGLGLHYTFPAKLLPGGWVQLAVGLPVVALGFFLVRAALQTFHHADTDERFARPTAVIVQHGTYGVSRNPMYLGVTVASAGVALAVNALWMLAVLPMLGLYFHFGVILREERYLERRFGAEYLGYRSRVRRWV